MAKHKEAGRRCREKIWDKWTYYQCQNPAVVERDGGWYCGIHDPERVRARREKADAKRAERWAKEDAEAKQEKKAREIGRLVLQGLALGSVTLEYDGLGDECRCDLVVYDDNGNEHNFTARGATPQAAMQAACEQVRESMARVGGESEEDASDQ